MRMDAAFPAEQTRRPEPRTDMRAGARADRPEFTLPEDQPGREVAPRSRGEAALERSRASDRVGERDVRAEPRANEVRDSRRAASSDAADAAGTRAGDDPNPDEALSAAEALASAGDGVASPPSVPDAPPAGIAVQAETPDGAEPPLVDGPEPVAPPAPAAPAAAAPLVVPGRGDERRAQAATEALIAAGHGASAPDEPESVDAAPPPSGMPDVPETIAATLAVLPAGATPRANGRAAEPPGIGVAASAVSPADGGGKGPATGGSLPAGAPIQALPGPAEIDTGGEAPTKASPAPSPLASLQLETTGEGTVDGKVDGKPSGGSSSGPSSQPLLLQPQPGQATPPPAAAPAPVQAQPSMPATLAPPSASAQAQVLQQQGPILSQVPLGAVPFEIGLKSLNGVNSFTIRLDPVELGRVDVSLDIEDGEVTARLVVERPETLALLQRDARSLERAFEQAGLRTTDASVQMSLRDNGDGRGNGAGGFADGRGRGEGERDGQGRERGGEPARRPEIEALVARRIQAGGSAGIDVRI